MHIDGREIRIFRCSDEKAPLVVLNTVRNENEAIWNLSDKSFTLLAVQIDDWNDSMTPWHHEGVAKWDSGYGGKADTYLESLTKRIIPSVLNREGLSPCFSVIAGYSLAGLFALYAMYRSEFFSRYAAVSGSLWFPGFTEFAAKENPIRRPERIYLSLGRKEPESGSPVMREVGDRTDWLYHYYLSEGIECMYEMNDGNHFTKPNERLVKGIRWILS